jgi:hypothetical protein
LPLIYVSNTVKEEDTFITGRSSSFGNSIRKQLLLWIDRNQEERDGDMHKGKEAYKLGEKK